VVVRIADFRYIATVQCLSKSDAVEKRAVSEIQVGVTVKGVLGDVLYTRTPRTAEESAFCKRACSISCRRVTGSTAEGLDFSNARELPLADNRV